MAASQLGGQQLGNPKNAFGAENRNRLIEEYFDRQSVSELRTHEAWKHVYRLLLWPDPTTGLAHCYESDKCQPGKNWYSRSLAFHSWLSAALGSTPLELPNEIDWLFRRAASDLAADVERRTPRLLEAAKRQMAPYSHQKFPIAGEDPKVISIVTQALEQYISESISEESWRLLTLNLRQYYSLENKRKNLVGEGFEDVLAHVARRTCENPALNVDARQVLHDLPGFNRQRRGEKPNKVDLVVMGRKTRTLVTAKWSIRADREKQFTTDFDDYVAAESDGRPFQYVLITNEFDPARLMRACEKLVSNNYLFNNVIHINTDALVATYGNAPEASAARVVKHISNGRLVSLSRWLQSL
ncbi:hypothetical protein [Rhodospira trueperi]|uniref:Uncharacterized protein n=1 Tax=Rhodospira trueperi TaxID=69960 RepID=A0A1G7EM40_9PROT|nr:hypothetical protein [Rhodospira trueperi]SDE64465.1 hypothetical protein SAMN05421720_109121 [Rhodospira trueperi]